MNNKPETFLKTSDPRVAISIPGKLTREVWKALQSAKIVVVDKPEDLRDIEIAEPGQRETVAASVLTGLLVGRKVHAQEAQGWCELAFFYADCFIHESKLPPKTTDELTVPF